MHFKNIFYYLLINFFKRSFKQNYIASLVISANPKLVITNVDNSRDFHLTSKIFENSKIKFIAVQFANRGDTVWKNISETKKIFIPEYLCFSKFDQRIHESKKCNIKVYNHIGSLKAALALNYIKSKNLTKKRGI